MEGWRAWGDKARLRGMRRHVQACCIAGRLQARPRPAETPDTDLQQRGAELCTQALACFSQIRAACGERVLLITLPSPAGRVWFEDLRCALKHIGVAALRIDDEQGLTPALVAGFQPTLLLGLDTDQLHLRLQAVGMDVPSRCTRLLIPARDSPESRAPLTAAESRRLDRMASGAGADLLLSLHAEPFMQRSVAPWLAIGKPLLWLPQAASPFRDRPHAGERVFDYAHLSVANPERVKAVWQTMCGILARHHGLFGERETWGFGVPRLPVEEHARCQALARVSLAPLVAPLLDVAGDLTQRVYAAAASATFQITELSPLTRQHFDDDELIAVPRGPGSLHDTFDRWLDDRPGRERIARGALERVYRDHTSLHRAVQLIDEVQARR
ncbi:glycosyltransferase family protein [Roseateles sp. LYH14W]|uniref:Glycosyltransferase n=1 Tax=Pelomonas parva TaxID=3299032 RepID=A0ABW7EWP1_9BURK